MPISVVMVHGIRTSASMWRSQVAWLRERGARPYPLDLPGHGTRMAEDFTLDGAFAAIDEAVTRAAQDGPVLLVGHSMGGLLCLEYAGRETAPPLAGLVAASATAVPRGMALATYRALTRTADLLPGRSMRAAAYILDRTLPPETRDDFGAGGYALDTQHIALATLSSLDLLTALPRIWVPTWLVNGQFDQLRVQERVFAALIPDAELIVVPRTSHLVTAMRPDVFNAVLGVALAVIERNAAAGTSADAGGKASTGPADAGSRSST